MKDYYYTLGISREASLSEIQQAYKKLSLKFHPEKNGHDPFYTLHYEKVKEAYHILSDDHKRFRYDKAFEKQLSKEVEDILEAPTPVIAAFFASKNTVRKGDIITISWEVFNADKVRINLIGEVASNGTQTIRLTVPAANEAYLYLDLEASNNNSIQSSKKRLALKNTAYQPGLASDPMPQPTGNNWEATAPAAIVVEEEPEKGDDNNKIVKKTTKRTKKRTPKKASSKAPANQQASAWAAYVLVAVLFFMIAVMLYTLFLINPIF